MLKDILTWLNGIPAFPDDAFSWITGCTTIFLLFWKLWETWRNRQKLDFRLLTTNRYSRFWHESELGKPNDKSTDVGSRLMVKAGDCKSSFEVLEFSITNNYRRYMNLGRFQIADWMFSDRYTPGMYDKKRDYRVFDLVTKDLTNLETYKAIPPGSTVGFRIESWEQANAGPRYASNHSYYNVELPKQYDIVFTTDVGRMRRRIKLSPPEANPVDYQFIYHWSNDLIGPMVKSMSTDFPQAVQSPYQLYSYAPWYKPLFWRNRLNRIKEWLRIRRELIR